MVRLVAVVVVRLVVGGVGVDPRHRPPQSHRADQRLVDQSWVDRCVVDGNGGCDGDERGGVCAEPCGGAQPLIYGHFQHRIGSISSMQGADRYRH